jgi:hypothetical protein
MQSDFMWECALRWGLFPLNSAQIWATISWQRVENSAGRWAVLVYKVVEVNSVTENELENVLNEWTAQGWRFDGLQFAMRESSKRPAMAFVIFTREEITV